MHVVPFLLGASTALIILLFLGGSDGQHEMTQHGHWQHDGGIGPSLSSEAFKRLNVEWEPELYDEIRSDGSPAQFMPDLKTPCINTGSVERAACVPGAYLIGNWQSNAKGLAALVGAHPDVQPVSNDRCFQHWTNDKGGRSWLRRKESAGFDPRQHLLAALGCVTSLAFYPGFPNRFHKFWEEPYWPCKAACVGNKTCWRNYFEATGEVWKCKAKALAYHDSKVLVRGEAQGGGASASFNVTPPFLLRGFYGSRVKLLCVLRAPIDRLRHAFYRHKHYAQRYGANAGSRRAQRALERTPGLLLPSVPSLLPCVRIGLEALLVAAPHSLLAPLRAVHPESLPPPLPARLHRRLHRRPRLRLHLRLRQAGCTSTRRSNRRAGTTACGYTGPRGAPSTSSSLGRGPTRSSFTAIRSYARSTRRLQGSGSRPSRARVASSLCGLRTWSISDARRSLACGSTWGWPRWTLTPSPPTRCLCV